MYTNMVENAARGSSAFSTLTHSPDISASTMATIQAWKQIQANYALQRAMS